MANRKKKEKVDWLKAKQDYLLNNLSLRDIADKYKVGLTSVAKHSTEDNWVKAKEEKQKEIETKVLQKKTETEIERRLKANEEHNRLYEESAEVIDWLLQEFKKAQQNKKKKPNSIAFALEKTLNCIEKVQKGQRLALKIDVNDGEETEPEVFVIRNLDEDLI